MSTETSQRLYVEVDAAEPCPLGFDGPPEVILFFASWAFATRFGGQHVLAQAAMRLQRRHKLELRPLLRYADRDVEDEADRQVLERSWQEAAPLAECARSVAAAIASGDDELTRLLEGYEDLGPRLDELAAICDWAAQHDARIRLSFDLGPAPDPPDFMR